MRFLSVNIRHLRAVLAVIEAGSVSAATHIVNLTQPAITQGLSLVEQRLGIPLFLRRPNGMTPTEAARLIEPRIRQAMELIRDYRVTTTQMTALIAFADAGSYRAASKSGPSEASLHRAISDLSITIGSPLVERRGRGVHLTEVGTDTARRFRLAQAEIRAAFEEIEQLRGAESGRITLGAMPLSRARILPKAIVDFQRIHPDVDIRIIEGSRRELIHDLRNGKIDLLVGALRLPEPPEADVLQTPLFEDHPIIIGRSKHPLAGQTITIEDLRHYGWILPPQGTPLRDHWQDAFINAGHKPPRVAIECGAVIMVRQLLLADDLLTVLSPDQLAVELDAGLLVKIADVPLSVGRQIGITTRADWIPTRTHKAMLEAIEQASIGLATA